MSKMAPPSSGTDNREPKLCGTDVFIPREYRVDHRGPSVAAKLRLVARYAALAGLSAVRTSCAGRLGCYALVEPIGIEPMT